MKFSGKAAAKLNKLGVVLLLVAVTLTTLGQKTVKPEKIDEFRKLSNDDLQARVLNFQQQLAKDNSTGFVVLAGEPLAMYFNQRRIMGCNRFMKFPTDNFQFKFLSNTTEVRVEFWKIPAGYRSKEFTAPEPDYKLPISKPVELTTSMFDDEFCPRYFDVAWYAHFLVANPRLSGRAVIDVKTKREFIGRVSSYRRELAKFGVAPNRMRYFLKHFDGEKDEQFWLVPPKRK
jgi:hypothetical protein